MDIYATTDLLPITRSAGTALRITENHRADLPAERQGFARDFVFLGYGPRPGDALYDAAGKPAAPRSDSGSLVDLYV